MKQIQLSQGQVALVDDEDFEYLSQWKWSALRNELGNRSRYYAYRGDYKSKPRTTILMHRLVLKAPPHKVVDHIDPERTLDNRKSNLRLATRQENSRNQRKQMSGTSSKFKGVWWNKRYEFWCVNIDLGVDGVIRMSGFRSEESAARAYDAVALDHFGEFAQINFPRTQSA